MLDTATRRGDSKARRRGEKAGQGRGRGSTRGGKRVGGGKEAMSDLNFLSFDSAGYNNQYASVGGGNQGAGAGAGAGIPQPGVGGHQHQQQQQQQNTMGFGMPASAAVGGMPAMNHAAGGFIGQPMGASMSGGMMGPAGADSHPMSLGGFMSVPSGSMGSMSQGNTMNNSAFGPPGTSYSFDDEPPLLEELGIDVGQILRKSTAMLRPHGLPPETLLDGDLIGPVLFCLLLATAHLLAGKVIFGYVLGWSLISSFVTSAVLGMLVPVQANEYETNNNSSDAAAGGVGGVGSMMSGGGGGSKISGTGFRSNNNSNSKVEFGMTASLLGYSMLPMVGGTVIASLLPRGTVSIVAVFLCVIWSATTCSSLLIIVTPSLKSLYWLVLYPCMLFYSVYALLALY